MAKITVILVAMVLVATLLSTCGQGDTSTPTPGPSLSPTNTSEPFIPDPTPTDTPTITPRPTPTYTARPTPTGIAIPTSTVEATPTHTPIPTPTIAPSPTPTITPLGPTYTLTVNEVQVDSLIVSLPDGSVMVSPEPNAANGRYLAGTQITLTPSATATSLFQTWSGDCTGTGPCVLTIDGNSSVVATFTPTYALTVNGTQVTDASSILMFGGSISISTGPNTENARYLPGTVVILLPVSLETFRFGGWGGDCSGTEVCGLAMNADWNVTAMFVSAEFPRWAEQALVNFDPASLSADGGEIRAIMSTEDKSMPTVISISFNLISPDGSTESVKGSSCGASDLGDFTSRCWEAIFNIPSNLTNFSNIYIVEASSPFIDIRIAGSFIVRGRTYVLFVNGPQLTGGILALIGGSISIFPPPNAPDGRYFAGTQVILRPNPDTGFIFDGWTGNCSGTGNCSITMDADRSVTGTFSQ